jgi:hypothetical protein
MRSNLVNDRIFMIDFLADKIDSFYVMPIITYEAVGKGHRQIIKPYETVERDSSSIEFYLRQYPYRFLDFNTSCRHCSWLCHESIMYPSEDITPNINRWSEIFDGVFFIRETTGIHLNVLSQKDLRRNYKMDKKFNGKLTYNWKDMKRYHKVYKALKENPEGRVPVDSRGRLLKENSDRK